MILIVEILFKHINNEKIIELLSIEKIISFTLKKNPNEKNYAHQKNMMNQRNLQTAL